MLTVPSRAATRGGKRERDWMKESLAAEEGESIIIPQEKKATNSGVEEL